MKIEKLIDLMCEIPEAYNTQVRMSINHPVNDGRYFDCDMLEWQDEESCEEPIIKKGRACWEVYYEVGFDADYTENMKRGIISIPAWLYLSYMEGKSNFVSWRQVELEPIQE